MDKKTKTYQRDFEKLSLSNFSRLFDIAFIKKIDNDNLTESEIMIKASRKA